MTDEDINSTANSVLDQLRLLGPPDDAFSIIVCLLLKLYSIIEPPTPMTIEQFADGLREDILRVYPTEKKRGLLQ